MYHGCSFFSVKHDPQRVGVWVQMEWGAEEQGQSPEIKPSCFYGHHLGC